MREKSHRQGAGRWEMSKLPHKGKRSWWQDKPKPYQPKTRHRVHGYMLAIALESTKVLGGLVKSQHKKHKVDRWRKLTRYAERALNGKAREVQS